MRNVHTVNNNYLFKNLKISVKRALVHMNAIFQLQYVEVYPLNYLYLMFETWALENEA